MKESKFSILKLLIFLMLFLVVLTMFLLIYIIPVMKEYKTNKASLKKYEVLYKKTKKEAKYLKEKKELLKQKYHESLKKYNEKFAKEDLKKYLESFISDITISNRKQKNTFEVKGTIKDINSFLDSIDSLNKYKNIVKVSFPIEIKKDEKSYKISFFVTVVNKELKSNL